MTKEQFTNYDHKVYMRWHRNLPNHFYMTDLDSLEYNSDHEPVALIDLKFGNKMERLDNNIQSSILAYWHLADRAGIPFYIVNYLNDESVYYYTSKFYCD